jgi:hypothetical protein
MAIDALGSLVGGIIVEFIMLLYVGVETPRKQLALRTIRSRGEAAF